MNPPSKTPRPDNRNGTQSKKCEKTSSQDGKGKGKPSFNLHLLKCRLPEYLRAIGCEIHFKNDDHFTTACPIHGGVKQKFHADRRHDGKWVWICRSGCGGDGGTVIDVHSRLTGVSDKSHDCMSGVAEVLGISPGMMVPRIASRKPAPAPKRELKLPLLDRGTAEEIEALAVLRYFQKSAVQHAVDLGCLRFGTVCGSRSWILTDSGRKVAEARRLDGKLFPEFGPLDARKAHTIKGSSKKWPVGLQLSDGMPKHEKKILLVEGGPDYLAALDLACRFNREDIHPVAMLGKAAIDREALDAMSGHRVRILPHQDPDGGGMEVAMKWHDQLKQVGCQVDGFSFEGLTKFDWTPVTDLNDLLEADEQSRKVWKEVLP